jgi:phage regulator Rha-like protein
MNKPIEHGLLPIRTVNEVPVIDSRIMADELSYQHESLMRLIKNHKEVIENDFGIIGFEIGKINGKGRPSKYCFLSENQALFVVALMKNTPKVMVFKSLIVRSFVYYREQIQQLSTVSLNKINEAILLLAESYGSIAGRITTLEQRVKEPKKAYIPSRQEQSDYVDARHITYDFDKVNKQNVRRVIIDERVYYSINDINSAIGSSTKAIQSAKKLNANQNFAIKIWVFGNTNPAWFTTRKGLELLVNGSRKMKANLMSGRAI